MTALFDLDGVLIDTESQYSVFWTEIGNHYVPKEPTFANDIKGHSLVSIFDKYFPTTELQEEIKKHLLAFEKKMHFPFMKGAEEVVRMMKGKGTKTAVVTSSDKDKMSCVYHEHPNMPLLFDRIFTAEDSGRSKPAPDCYLNAANFFETDIKKCVIFEDSLNGLISAKNSGGMVVGLTTTLPKNIVSQYSDIVINNLSEVVNNVSFWDKINKLAEKYL